MLSGRSIHRPRPQDSFDRAAVPSLNYSDFVESVTARLAHVAGALAVGTLVALTAGCGSPQPAQVEESHSSGRITVVAAKAAARLVTLEADTFRVLYPQAQIEVRAASSREAVQALFGAQAHAAVTTRDLLPDERRAAVQGRLEIEGYRFAREGLVMVVHPHQVVEKLALDEVKSIFRSGEATWSAFGGGSEKVVPVVQPPDADATEFFSEAIMSGEPMQAPAVTVADDSLVAHYVATHPAALGYVSLGWAHAGVKPVALARIKGLDYTLPDPKTIYDEVYPLTRSYTIYLRPQGSELAAGFATFVTSGDGQKLVLGNGLMPATVPVRFVRRSPMQSTH